MKKLVKKEVTKYFSFGLDGVNDEWAIEDNWDGFTKYKNRDGLIVITFKTSGLDMVLEAMLADILIGDEAFAVASPDVVVAINNLKEDNA